MKRIRLDCTDFGDPSFQAWLKDNGITFEQIDGDEYEFTGEELDLQNMIDMFFFDTDLYLFIEDCG